MSEVTPPPGTGYAAGYGSGSAIPSSPLPPGYVRPSAFPNSLIGDVAEFIYCAAPYPNATIALAGGIAFVAALSSRAFNIHGAGLNQYILNLAPTGLGKEAVADAFAKIIIAVQPKQPRITDFRGPGELVSAPGLFKWLSKLRHPVMYCIIGEFGLMLKTMAASNASPNMAGLQRVILHLWSKSGQASIFDASAYSDSDKNTRAMRSVALTIYGEGVPESFYSTLDVGMVTSGLLPRVSIFETNDPKPYRNQYRMLHPSPELVEAIAKLTARSLELSDREPPEAHNVLLDETATKTFDDFGRFAVDRENSAANDVVRGLWARADLKAMKLAALNAVARDNTNPVVTHDDCMWATNLVVDQTTALIAKFESGDVGEVAGNEAKQEQAILRCIKEYNEGEYKRFASYGVTEEMHNIGAFTQTYISKRVRNMPVFNDKIGRTKAIERVLKDLAHTAAVIQEFNTIQTQEMFNTRAKTYIVCDFPAFRAMIRAT